MHFRFTSSCRAPSAEKKVRCARQTDNRSQKTRRDAAVACSADSTTPGTHAKAGHSSGTVVRTTAATAQHNPPPGALSQPSATPHQASDHPTAAADLRDASRSKPARHARPPSATALSLLGLDEDEPPNHLSDLPSDAVPSASPQAFVPRRRKRSPPSDETSQNAPPLTQSPASPVQANPAPALPRLSPMPTDPAGTPPLRAIVTTAPLLHTAPQTTPACDLPTQPTPPLPLVPTSPPISSPLRPSAIPAAPAPADAPHSPPPIHSSRSNSSEDLAQQLTGLGVPDLPPSYVSLDSLFGGNQTASPQPPPQRAPNPSQTPAPSAAPAEAARQRTGSGSEAVMQAAPAASAAAGAASHPKRLQQQAWEQEQQPPQQQMGEQEQQPPEQQMGDQEQQPPLQPTWEEEQQQRRQRQKQWKDSQQQQQDPQQQQPSPEAQRHSQASSPQHAPQGGMHPSSIRSSSSSSSDMARSSSNRYASSSGSSSSNSSGGVRGAGGGGEGDAPFLPSQVFAARQDAPPPAYITASAAISERSRAERAQARLGGRQGSRKASGGRGGGAAAAGQPQDAEGQAPRWRWGTEDGEAAGEQLREGAEGQLLDGDERLSSRRGRVVTAAAERQAEAGGGGELRSTRSSRERKVQWRVDSNDQALSYRITASTELVQLDRLFQKFGKGMNHVHLVLALNRVAVVMRGGQGRPPLGPRERTLAEAVAGRVLLRLQRVTHLLIPIDHATILSALAKLRYYEAALVEELLQLSQPLLPQHNTMELSNTLWALATLQHTPPPAWWGAFLDTSQARIPEFTEQGLAITLWSAAKLGLQPRRSWVEAILAAAQPRLGAMQPQHHSNLIWALAALDHRPDAGWLEAYYEAIQKLLRWHTNQSLSNVLHSLAKLQLQPPPEWLGAVLEAGRQLLPRAPSISMAVTVWSLGKLRVDPGEAWWGSFLAASRGKLGSFPPLHMQQVACGMYGIRRRPDAAWMGEFYEQVQHNLAAYSYTSLQILLFSIAVMSQQPALDPPPPAPSAPPRRRPPGPAPAPARQLPVAPSRSWLAAVAEALGRRVREADLSGLVFTLWSFWALGAAPPERFMEQALVKVEAKLPGCQARDLRTLMFSLGSLRYSPPPSLGGCLLRESLRLMPKLSRDALVNVSWGAARTGLAPGGEWGEAVLDRAVEPRVLGGFKEGTLGSLVWALEALGIGEGGDERGALLRARLEELKQGGGGGGEGSRGGEWQGVDLGFGDEGEEDAGGFIGAG